jgi:hypothetical protein
LVWLAALAVVMGCGRGQLPTYRAGGKVAFPDGTPLSGGSVEFQPLSSEHAVSARGKIQPDGTFQLGTFGSADGAVEGEHRALVIPPAPDRGPMLPSTLRAAVPIIDPRFQRFETSELKFAVTRDPAKNQFVIQVERPRK